MNPYTELITRYINGELSAADKAAFEAQLSSNAELKKEYELQLKLVEGIKRMGLKNQMSSSFKKVKTTKLINQAAIGVAITLAILGAVLVIKNQSNKAPNEIRYKLNEEGKTNWSDADKNLESQMFRINPDRDTIIETRQGIVIAIPAASFEHSTGEGITGSFDLEIKEAMTTAEIMKAGLSTMSNDRLLETGGMFYINARQGNNNLVVNRNKPLNVNVPVNNDKNDMMLFKGERRTDGSINWVEPKPMKRKLTTVDIGKLNFYPEHFLDSLKSMGFNIKNKMLTDSVYYSFSGYCDLTTDVFRDDFPVADTVICKRQTSVVTQSIALNVSTSTSYGISSRAGTISGQTLFTKNCATCHTLSDQKLTGPGLQGVMQRVPSRSWMKNWILNNERMIRSGDAYANKIYRQHGQSAMSVFEGHLSDRDIETLIDFIAQNSVKNNCEIDPSRIKAIWNKKFNHSILATKEFEERLKVIFKTCDSRVFNLYVNNLDKNLYEIDSMAAGYVSGELKNTFLGFYARKDGGVDISDAQSKQLQHYFEEKRSVYTKAVTATLQKMYDEEGQKNQTTFQELMKHQNSEAIRTSKTFMEEFNLNLDDAYRQLGIKRPTAVSGNSLTAYTASYNGSYISAPLIQTGWCNVDRYTLDATKNRSSLDFKDSFSGKTARIAYKPVSVSVENYASYDRVLCYMIPDKLSSFQTIAYSGDRFKEKLDELIGYSIVTIAFKGEKRFYNEIKQAQPQHYGLRLTPIKPEALDQFLNSSFPLNKATDLTKDFNYQVFDSKETIRKNKITKRETVRNHLLPIVLPCATAPTVMSEDGREAFH